MRIIRKFIPILLLTFVFQTVTGTHLTGSDITYKRIDSLKYKVSLTIYRDCRGIPLSAKADLKISSTGHGTTTKTASVTSITDVTPVCRDSTNTPCTPINTRAKKGIEAHLYEFTLDLKQAPYNTWISNGACEFDFSWASCCRNGAITTGVSGGFFIYSTINICNGENNSSPTFSGAPIVYACCRQPLRLSFGGQDFEDLDSLSYELVPALGNSKTNTLIPSAPLSVNNPITTYCGFGNSPPCTAVPSANPPLGFYFDKKTGYCVFTPNDCSEIGVIAFEIKEWRKVAGVMKVVGKTRRDFQVWIENCDRNNPPRIYSSVGSNIKINKSQCEELCFQISTKDDPVVVPPPGISQTPDTTIIMVNNLPPGATFTYLDTNNRERTGQFCWKVPDSIASNFNTQVVFTVWDQMCPRPSSSQVVVTISLDSALDNAKLSGHAKLDQNDNCETDLAEPGINRTIIAQVNGRSQKVRTDQSGFYQFCVPADSGIVRVVPTPFYEDKCRSDSSLVFAASKSHTIDFPMRLKDGLYGRIFNDKNRNCTQDNGELYFNGVEYIIAQPGNIVSSIDEYGNYYLPLDSNQKYTIHLRDSNKFLHLCNAKFVFDYAKDSAYNAPDILVDGYKLDHTSAHWFGGFAARLGFNQTQIIQIENRDTQNYRKTHCTLEIDSNLSNINITANTGLVQKLRSGLYRISFDSLKTSSTYDTSLGWTRSRKTRYKQDQYITLQYKADTNYFNINSSFKIRFWVDSLSESQSFKRFNDTVKRRIRVRGAVDPNIKSSFQEEYITPVSTRIDYHIQFQNSGNDTAINIAVFDTLPDYIDYSSFQLQSSSHDVRPLLNNNILHFYFDNIYLVDSMTNPEQSIGNFSFSVYTYDTMTRNLNIDNSASIYFDVQKPVRTNTSTLAYHSPTQIESLPDTLFCKNEEIKVPFTNYFNLENKSIKYYLELSLAQNNFNNPQRLDTISSSHVQDTFTINLPQSIPSGKYQFRVIGEPQKAIPFASGLSPIFEYKTLDKAGIHFTDPSPYCEEQLITATASSNFGSYTFVRNLTDVSNPLLDSVYSFNLNSNDQQLHVLMNYKNNCILSSDTLKFSVSNNPKAAFELVDSVICGANATFEIINSSIHNTGNKYELWANTLKVDSASSKTKKMKFVSPAFGKHELQLKMTDVNGCSDTITQFTYNGIQPKAGFTTLVDTSCQEKKVKVTSTATHQGNGISSIIWLWGDGNTSSEPNNIYSYPTFGNYTITQLVSDYLGCTDSFKEDISILAELKITASVNDICKYEYLIFEIDTQNSEVASFDYTVIFDGKSTKQSYPAQPTLVNQTHNAGTYTSQVIAKSKDGCGDTITLNHYIYDRPVANFTTSIKDYQVDITNLSPQILNTWDFDNQDSNVINNTSNFTYTYSANGNYDINLKVEDANTCVNTYSQKVTIKGNPQSIVSPAHSIFNIPSIYSPNNDGVNDHFVIGNADQINQFEMTLFNSLGQTIYHTNSVNHIFANASLNNGVYLYQITIRDKQSNEHKITGRVTIIN